MSDHTDVVKDHNYYGQYDDGGQYEGDDGQYGEYDG